MRSPDSSNKPFCDGTHKRIGFDGTLTAMEAAA
jgi:CDGSH-type Zn-finger protein